MPRLRQGLLMDANRYRYERSHWIAVLAAVFAGGRSTAWAIRGPYVLLVASAL